NHTSSAHPWFKEAASDPSSPKRSWYVWSEADAGWKRPWDSAATWYRRGGAYYYALFDEGMPDLNFESPEVRAELLRVSSFWLDRGADGFRLDAARYLVETGP